MAAVVEVGTSLRPESIADLAAQWREAYAIAEAQEQRLTAVEAAAAHLYPGAQHDAASGELIHQIQRERGGWWREAEAVDASLGLPALEAAANSAWAVVERVSERLLTLRPQTVQEAAVKFGILMTLLKSDHQAPEATDRLQDFMEDLEQLASAASPAH